VLTAALAGCGGVVSAGAEQTVRELGAVPIPTPPATPPTPVAEAGRPQLLTMGAPVEVAFPTGRGLVVANGPSEDPTTPPPGPAVALQKVFGTITLKLTAYQGSLQVSAADLSSRDQEGRVVALSPVQSSPITVVAVPGRPAMLVVRGVFQDGSAQLTLRHDGRLFAVWDFSMELD
jgi:hypothetical protein